MSKKISNAQRKFLEAIPENTWIPSVKMLLEGRLRPFEWPAGTNYKTVMRLRELGLIRQARSWITEVPITLTEKGMELLGRSDPRLEKPR